MENFRPKILLLITNLGRGGAQRVFHDHALALSEKYDVIEVAFDKVSSRIYDTGFPLFYLDKKSFYTFFGPIGRLLNRARLLRKMVKQHDADMVISHMDGANWVNSLSFSKAKKIFVVHGTVMHDKAQTVIMQWLRKKLIIPFLYKEADAIVSVSEGIAKELRDNFSLKTVVSIPNFFDHQTIRLKSNNSIIPEHKSIFDNYSILVTSGRFAEQKQQNSLFPIFKAVKERFPSVRLVILGDGELRSALLEEAISYGFRIFSVWDQKHSLLENDSDVYFLGYVSNPYQYLSKSKLFLFPSAWEGFPLALCEAMICGVPVLTTDCPTGPREILSPLTADDHYGLLNAEFTANGVLLPLLNKASAQKEWIDAILILLNDQEKCNCIAASAEKRMTDFEKSKILDRWKSLISQLLTETKKYAHEK